MADFKVVVSDPKTKTYQFDVKGTDANKFIGKSIGENIDGGVVGLKGYTLKITGGSDKTGVVMRRDIPGPKRRKILLSASTGYKPKSNGVRRRKLMHGREIATDTIQINTKIIGYGEKPIDEILGGSPAEGVEE
ncbi:Ribosomal protein S6e [Methanosalsum zhilinae DSM 4017]|uniref:Small ribosomal subunit protein eS6 n=1 Tax=Methanosalsum zhilinae (strain DSM 4017 / NBRC 107636 / OCM 62 / WeN5) TaxID=679901 RepID=F7XMZ8_METZD|nr:30S ribosomal protein S6e [Methanosalsum zhilinae]AEH61107.1 Ribosomal protein S6e [Methanosalsum zhilinae DSM 4017]